MSIKLTSKLNQTGIMLTVVLAKTESESEYLLLPIEAVLAWE